MTKRRMAAITVPNLTLEIDKDCHHHHEQHGVVKDEIEGLIKVFKDGHVERTHVVSCVTTALPPEYGVASRDIFIDNLTNLWARFYVPVKPHGKLPLIVYFHGGGFCLGSAAWSCYHDFLARLAATAGCLIMSVNYRLAPENPLPAAYEDGIKAIIWLKHQAQSSNHTRDGWSRQCNFSRIFIGGDSAGANIAYNVVSRLNGFMSLKPFGLKGIILIQPFFGGEARTNSEKYAAQSQRSSALTLAASDAYWSIALPRGSNRDHPWCNPPIMTKGSGNKLEPLAKSTGVLVCISEMDILRDRNVELVGVLGREGNKRVEHVVHKGVGHAFQVLSKSQLSQIRTLEMMSQIKAFMGHGD